MYNVGPQLATRVHFQCKTSVRPRRKICLFPFMIKGNDHDVNTLDFFHVILMMMIVKGHNWYVSLYFTSA